MSNFGKHSLWTNMDQIWISNKYGFIAQCCINDQT